jgi:hypothetical protein
LDLRGTGARRLTIQPKLTVGARGDAHEQEADRVADQVMQMPGAGPAPLQATPKNEQGGGLAAPDIVHEALHAPGRPLDPTTRAFMEPRFGHDFSQVRVHNDATAAQAAHAMRANAFTSGRHIVFRDGALGGPQGNRLLAHELTHVVQQRRSGGAVLQRDAVDDSVKKVRSPTLDAAKDQTADIDEQLGKRLDKRKAELNKKLADENKRSHPDQAKIDALNKDLAKPVSEVIDMKKPDHASNAVRKDIAQSAGQLERDKKREKAIGDKWSKLDSTFASQDVRNALGPDTITPADLKALIAQESGDLMNEHTGHKGRSGIAQLSPKEEKQFGGAPGDRDKPEKAIVMAAKAVADKAHQLDKLLKNKPTGKDRRKFIMGAYNAGEFTIRDAQNFAIADGKSGTTWDELTDGGDKSALHRAVAKDLAPKVGAKASAKAKKKAAAALQVKQGEVRKYPTEILDRLN